MPLNKNEILVGDILIPVMGTAGAGKSSFINTLLKNENEKMTVGKGLESSTRELGFGYIETIEGHPPPKNGRIVLVDTPGFDDTNEADFTILKKIATGLEECYEKGANLGGVIYLHDISGARFAGSDPQRLRTFRSLFGSRPLGNVILATTKWGLKVPDSESRFKELENEHWKPFKDRKAKILRFEDSYESAWSFIDAIISASDSECIDPKTPFDPTAFSDSSWFTVLLIKTFHTFGRFFA